MATREIQGDEKELVTALAQIQSQIRQAALNSGREPSAVHLLAVSKGQPLSAIKAAYALGVRDFGESYWQEAREKLVALADLEITWHYLGALQRNKWKAIATHFDWVHTVSTAEELVGLAQYRTGKPLQMCLQVDVEHALGRRGASLEQLPELVALAAQYPQLILRGLMVMVMPALMQEAQMQAFRTVADAAKRFDLDTLSMGMSEDFETAIAAGSTWVRIGQRLLGKRGR